jgi:hypothetical protein
MPITIFLQIQENQLFVCVCFPFSLRAIPHPPPFLERVSGRPLELPTSFNMADTTEHEPTVEVSAGARPESHRVAVSGERAAIFYC